MKRILLSIATTFCFLNLFAQTTTSLLGGGVCINEFLPDPNGAVNNFDTNKDGTFDSTDDEFIELYNTSGASIDISGWEVWDAGTGMTYKFPNGSVVGPNEFVLILANVGAGSMPIVSNESIAVDVAGSLGINNGADNIVVYDPNMDEYIQVYFNGDAVDNPPTDYAGFSATATLVGTAEDFGNDGDGESLVRVGEGDVATSRHSVASAFGLLATPGAKLCGLALSYQVTNVSCSGASDGGAEVILGGTTPYNYFWFNGETTSSITGMPAQAVSVTVFDGNGCVESQSMTISEPAPLTVTLTTVTETCLRNNGEVHAMVTGGRTPYTYSWFDPFFNPTGSNSPDLENISSGSYFVNIQDACFTFTGGSATVPFEDFDVDVDFGMTSACGASDGVLNTTVTGGQTPYSYNWDNGETSASITAQAGIYIVTVEDNQGCVEVNGGGIVDPGAPDITVTTQNVTCRGYSDGAASVAITGGTTPYSITWGQGLSGTPIATTTAIENQPADVYLITVVDGAGCKTFDGRDIEEPWDNFDAFIDDPWGTGDVSCNGASDGWAQVQIPWGAQGWGTPFTYEWSTGFTDVTTNTFSNENSLTGGSYNVTVTDGGGCERIESFNIVEPAALSLTANKQDDLCGDGSAWMSGSASGGTPPYSYFWSTGHNQKTVNSVNSGTYDVTVYDNNGCMAGPVGVTITSVTPMVTNVTTTDATCGNANGAIGVTVTDGTSPYSYLWSNGVTTALNSGIVAGLYGVTVIDANGCQEVDGQSVNDNGDMNSTRELTSVTCAGDADGEFSITVTGSNTPFTYEWYDGDFNLVATGTTTLTGLSGGLFMYSVTDALGCINSGADFINENDPIDGDGDVFNNTCYENTNGRIDLNPIGGDGGPYSFLWDDMSTTQSLTGLMTGTYDVTITDNKGCTAVESYTVTSSIPQMFVSTTVTDDICAENEGVFTAQASGGTGSFNYMWNMGGNGTVKSGLSVGFSDYVWVFDPTWTCFITSTTLTVNGPAMSLDLNVTTTPTNCGAADGTATLEVMGATPPYNFEWSNGTTASGLTTQTLTGLSAGILLVTVTDANGCEQWDGNAVTNPGAPSITLTTNDATCAGGTDGEMSVAVTGGQTPYSYYWEDGAGNPMGTTATITGLMEGVAYLVTVSDNQLPSCLALDGDVINSPDPITMGVWWQQNPNCAGAADGLANIYGQGGVGSYSYSWSSGETGDFADELVAGANFVTIEDGWGCIGIGIISLTDPSAITITTSSTNANCGSPDGTATASATGGNPGYNFTWSNGDGGSFITNLFAGNYTVTVQDFSGCEETATVVVNNNNAPSVTVTTDNHVACNASNDGETSSMVTGGVSPLSYMWSNGATNTSLTGLIAGNYGLTVTDDNGCSASGSTVVNQPAALSGTITVNSNVSCKGMSDGDATVNVSGGISPYSYLWSIGVSMANATGLEAGIADVTITDGNLCQATFTTTIIEPNELNITLSASDVTCNGDSDGDINSSVSGGTAPYSYSWSNGATTANISSLSGNTFTLTVTDANGCLSTADATVTEPTILALTTSVTQATCGNADGSATAMVSGGVGPYSYSWQGGGALMTKTGLAAGTYSVTVFDANLCETSSSVTITNPNSPSVDAGTGVAICNGASTSIGGSPTASGGTSPYTYEWSNGASLTSTSIANPSASPTTNTSYTVTVTDNNNCKGTDVVVITVNDNPSVTFTTANIDCNGAADGEMTANAANGQAPYSYAWSTGDNTATITGLDVNTYSVTITDANLCQTSGSDNITEPTALTLTATSTSVTCYGGTNGTATASASGGESPYSYSWSQGGSMAVASGLGAGTYSVTIFDNNLCETNITVSIAEPLEMTVTVSTTQASCGASDGTATASVSNGVAPYSYTWNVAQTGAMISGLPAGVYNVVVTDNKGCAANDSEGLSNSAAPTVSVTALGHNDCFNGSEGSAMVSVSGGTSPYTYTWDDAASQTTVVATGLIAGTYNVGVLDNVGCLSIGSVTITESSQIMVSLSASDVSCNGAGDGSIMSSVSGGVSGYSYAWSNGGSSSDISGLGAGSYSVTVTDANACSATASASISEPTALSATVTSNDPTSCGGIDGDAMASASGGTAPYTYNWGAGASAMNTATGLSAGTVNVTVMDANGCDVTGAANLTDPGAPTITLASNTSVTCNGGNDGELSFTASGSPTYTWYDGSSNVIAGLTTNSATGLSAGSYSIEADDAGCVSSLSAVVMEPALIAINSSSTNASCNGNADGSASVTVSGGMAPYDYMWDNGSTTNGITEIAATYMVTVTDANGCEQSTSIVIGEPMALSLTLSANDVTTNGGNDGSISSSVSGGTTAYTYMWSNGSTASSLSSLSANSYSVTVTDANGCSIDASAMVNEPAASCTTPLMITVSTTDESCLGMSDGTAMVNVAGGDATNYTYSWVNGSTLSTTSGLTSGAVSVTVTDGGSCQTQSGNMVNAGSSITVTASATNETVAGASDGAASVSVVGGTSIYSYQWSNMETTANITGLAPGSYSVTVLDNGNCPATANVTVAAGSTVTCALTVTASATDESCGDEDGTATVVVSGGTTPYNYNWSSGGSLATENNLSAGVYNVTVVDANSCSDMATVTVTGTAAVMIDITVTDPSCGNADGSAVAVASGGDSNYTFAWEDLNGNDLGSGSSASGLGFGGVLVTVTDGNGCQDWTGSALSETGAPSVTVTSTDVTCYGASSGAVEATVSGGTGPYTYQWGIFNVNTNVTTVIAGETGSSIIYLPANEQDEMYFVTVTGSDGCSALEGTSIDQPDEIVLSIVSTSVTANGASDGTASVAVNGGTSPYSYSWNTGATVDAISGLSGAVYSVTVMDANGCSEDVSVVVSEPGVTVTPSCNVSVTLTATDVTTNGGNDGSVVATVSGDQGNITYAWSVTGSGSSITNLVAGTYFVTVTDDIVAGCTATASVVVSEPTFITEKENNKVRMYPNPNNGSFIVDLGDNVAAQLRVVDITGKLMKQVILNEQISKVELDVPSGLYFVEVTNGSATTVERIVVR